MAGAWIKTVFSVYDKNEYRVQMYSINFNFSTDPPDLSGINLPRRGETPMTLS
jgi:hypothetical protein